MRVLYKTFKVVQCINCGRCLVWGGVRVFKCRFCGISKVFFPKGGKGKLRSVSLKVFFSSDDGSEAARVCSWVMSLDDEGRENVFKRGIMNII